METYGHVGTNGIALTELVLEKRVKLVLPHFSAEKIIYEHFHLSYRDMGMVRLTLLSNHISILTLSKVTSESITYSSVLLMAFL